MKLLHLSDLHLGKRISEFSMIEDQKYILTQILRCIDQEEPDGVLIAGDVYDKPLPPVEAVGLLDDFLTELAAREIPVFLIGGNHDSQERLSFGGRLVAGRGIHLAPVYGGAVEPITLHDAYGPVRIYLLPFLKPAAVRRYFPEAEIESYTDALSVAIAQMNVDESVRNVLVTHQFVTGASRSESEEISVGGTDNVDAVVFSPFDYVALGHLHSPQNCGSERIRYCGTPLKYSFSEVNDEKSVTVITLGEKGNAALRTVPLTPLREMRCLRGAYNDLMERSFYENTPYREDYLRITLTDEEDIPEAAARLRTVYHNLMKLDYDNSRTRAGFSIIEAADCEQKSPLELFAELFEMQNGHEMSEEQRAYMKKLMEDVWEEME